MKRIVLLLLILVAFIGDNEAQSRKKYTSKKKKKTKKEIVIESEPEDKKIRKINLYLNFMSYDISPVSTDYWQPYASGSINPGDEIINIYQEKIRKSAKFTNVTSLGVGIRTYANISPKLKFEYGLGADLTSSIYDYTEETVENHLIEKYRIIKESIFIPGERETLEEYPFMQNANERRYYQTSDREEHNFISVVLPLELRYSIFDNIDLTGGLVTRLPIFERRAFEVKFWDDPSDNTAIVADNGLLINRFLAFASIGARFQTNQGFTVSLSYQHLLNSFIMRRSELLSDYDFNNKKVTGSQINFSIGYSF
jgi:hypothetical protein